MPDFGLDVTLGVVLLLCLMAFLGALVRGFSGFGDALVYLPIAGIFLDPIAAIVSFLLVAVIGPLPLVANAARIVDRKIAIPLNLAMLFALPFGVYLLRIMNPDVFRTALAIIAILLAMLMLLGWRPRIAATPFSATAMGLFAGFVGGWSGVPGAIMIFYFLNSPMATAQIRAQGLLVLVVFDMSLLILIAIGGDVTLSLVLLSALLLPFYILGGLIGQRLFNPEKREFYRGIAIAAIFASGLIGIPWAAFT